MHNAVKLNVGAGRDPLDGWTNLDIAPWPGIDVVADVTRYSFLASDSVDEIRCSHTLEHIADPLAAMQELWRVAKPGCTAEFHTPYGSSDIAWTDPTHLRPYFVDSWTPFGAPYHWRMEQHYTADWRVDEVLLLVRSDIGPLTVSEATRRLWHERNIVREMRAYLTAMKPARPATREAYEALAPVKIRMEIEA